MKMNSLQVKLPLLIALGFALTTILVVSIVERKMTHALKISQEAEYGEKLQTILLIVQGNYERLQKTGMVATYREDFEDATLRQLRRAYVRSDDHGMTPFIIDAEGKLLLTPRWPSGASAAFGTELLRRIHMAEGSTFTFSAPGAEKAWCVYQTFKPWNWKVGYLVPLELEYRLAHQLNRILVLVFSGITVLVVALLVWLVRAQLRPITALADISLAMAEGHLERRVPSRRNDEIGMLADNFNRMQAAIQETIEALRSSEENLKITLNSIGDAVIATDDNSRVIRMNPVAEKLTGWTASEAIGRPLADIFRIVRRESREVLENPAGKILADGIVTGLSDDTVLIARNGSEHQIAESGAPIRNADGEMVGVVLVFRDVTKEMALQEQLLQSRKMETIGQLAGGIAHDFNNMLGGIIGAAELLKKRLPHDPKTSKFLGMIMDSAERAADLTKKLLAFSRKQHIGSTPVDVHSALRNTLSLLENTIDRRIRIHTDLTAETSMVVGDPAQLQGAFLNICINAAQAMSEGGDLSIFTQVTELDKAYCEASRFNLQPGLFLEVAIRDNGCGIPPENLERIFEPFFTTKEQGRGTGLGLASVFGTVQTHNGAVTAYSEVGRGSSFSVLLPLSDAQPVPVDSTAQVKSGRGTILIVDDEGVMRATAAAILEDLGYQVLLAENGRHGIEVFRNQYKAVDLVLLDMIMPEMNGRDCFVEMKKIDPGARIVLSSGFTQNDDLTELRAAGLAGFIRKPYRSTTLSRTIAAVLNGTENHATLWSG